MRKKELHTGILLAAIVAVSVVLLSQVLLRNLFLLLSFDDQFFAIFAQIRRAPMWPPVLTVLILSSAASAMVTLLWRKRRLRFLAVIAGVFSWLLVLGTTIMLTRVNGIRFGNVLFSLLDLMEKGGL